MDNSLQQLISSYVAADKTATPQDLNRVIDAFMGKKNLMVQERLQDAGRRELALLRSYDPNGEYVKPEGYDEQLARIRADRAFYRNLMNQVPQTTQIIPPLTVR